ncbi:hypothetical protein V1504DRAFT_458405 [Lipomyces starkeyi]
MCRRIAIKVSDEMGASFGPNDCWLSRKRALVICYGNRQEKPVAIFRLLCFLADPTPLNWASLSRNGTLMLCKHSCSGQQRNNGHRAHCINGIYHARVLTALKDGSRTTPTSSHSIALSTQPLAEISPSIPHTTRVDLERRLHQLFIDLHTSNPNHEIFGEPAQGLLRLPLYPSRTSDQSWAKTCKNIALGVLTEMKSGFQLDACWMSRSKITQITRWCKGKKVLYKHVSIVRLLAFLAQPTTLHWKYLSDNGLSALDTPFSHACNRGEKRDDGQVAFCINGLYHGRFATINESNSHRHCVNGARPLCPGHGSPPVKCIFTNPDGSLRPCLNQEDSVPKCACAKPCF